MSEHSASIAMLIFLISSVLVFVAILVWNGHASERRIGAAPSINRQPLTAFLHEAAAELQIGVDSVEMYRLSHALRQAGVDGSIQFFGNDVRKYNSGTNLSFVARVTPLVKISEEEFAENWIDPIPVTRDGENVDIILYQPGTYKRIYSNLHVNNAQALAWLKAEARKALSV